MMKKEILKKIKVVFDSVSKISKVKAPSSLQNVGYKNHT